MSDNFEDVTVAASITATLIRIWENVLEVSDIGVLDDFFDLGGDSILAITMIDRLREYGVPISLADLLGHPVLGDLASYARDCAQHPADTPPD